MKFMEVKRCPWPHITDPAYEDYHDHEWGKLNLDEHYLYQMLVLEKLPSGIVLADHFAEEGKLQTGICKFRL